MLKLTDVARMYRVDTETVKIWCQLGRLRPRRTGPDGEPLFRREDVTMAYISRSFRRAHER